MYERVLVVCILAVCTISLRALPLSSDSDSPMAMLKYCTGECNLPNCMLSYKENCFYYIQCVIQQDTLAVYKRACGLNTVFDPIQSTCIHLNTMNYQILCHHNENKCLDKTVKSFPVEGECNQYYTCMDKESASDNLPVGKCCPREHQFENGSCVPAEKTCHRSCPIKEELSNVTSTTPYPTTPLPCTGKVVPGTNGTQYTRENNFQVLKCPPGTIFFEADEICDCDHDPNYIKPKGCTMDVVLDFDGINNDANVYVNFHKVEQKQRMGSGIFRNDYAVRIPHYGGNDNLAKRFTIIAIFKDLSTEDKQSTLISTCRSAIKNKATIAVRLDPSQRKVMFSIDPQNTPINNTVGFQTPYDKKSWNYLRFVFDGKRLFGEVIPISNSTSDIHKAVKKYQKTIELTFKGTKDMVKPEYVELERGNGELTMGKCYDSNEGFVGEIAQLKVSKLACFDMDKPEPPRKV